MRATRPSQSAWAPLRVGAFRALWSAALLGLTGAWFQTVGAQWQLVQRPHSLLPRSTAPTIDTDVRAFDQGVAPTAGSERKRNRSYRRA